MLDEPNADLSDLDLRSDPVPRRHRAHGAPTTSLDRRSLLGAGAVGLLGLAGCSFFGTPKPTPSPPGRPTASGSGGVPTPTGSASSGATPSSIGSLPSMDPSSSSSPTTDPDPTTAPSPTPTTAPPTTQSPPAEPPPDPGQPPVLPPGQQYTGFAAAAAAATPVAGVLDPANQQMHLLRRVTFGPRPADVAELSTTGIDTWLSKQLSPASFADPAGDQAWGLFPLAGASAATVRSSTKEFSWDAMFETTQGTLARQVFSSRQLFEVVVDVFANLLHVTIPADLWATAPSYVPDVIRPHAFGRYEDMLLAAMRHPAMLIYLSNAESTKQHVNENLGRELLELHTVGLSAGYTEADVQASAKILTGRTVKDDEFTYEAGRHFTGPVTVLGWSDPNPDAAGGLAVGDAYLRYLAQHPATARSVCRKLAVRFVADNPSTDLVERLAAVYQSSGSDILAVLRAIFLSSDFWSAVGLKVRRPLEDAVGGARVLDVGFGSDSRKGVESMYWTLNDSGQTPYGWEPPNGYPDVAAAWLNTGGVLARWNAHRALVGGWWKGLAWPDPADVVPTSPTLTAGAWIDAVCTKVTGQTFPAPHRAALLTFVGVANTAPSTKLDPLVVHVLPLVFDSAYFQVR